MVYEIVHQQPLYRVFRASIYSCGYLVKVFFQIIEIVLPLVIIFTTQGLWKKFGEFREIPKVSYEGKYIILLNSDTNSFILSSSFSVLNVAQQSRMVIAEENWYWSSPDELNIRISMPLNNVTVDSLLYVVFLDYRLDYHNIIQAQVALTGTVRELANTQELRISGGLRADQGQPFRGLRQYFILVDEMRQDFEHYKPGSILSRIAVADLAVTIARKVEIRLPRTTDGSSFTLSFLLHIIEDSFIYKTELWELLKWAWIQYFATYAIIRYICQETLTYLFSNNVLEAVGSTKI